MPQPILAAVVASSMFPWGKNFAPQTAKARSPAKPPVTPAPMPTRKFVTAPPRPGVLPEELTDQQQAWQWLEAERPVLFAAIAQAAAHGFDAHACQLPWTLRPFLERLGHWHDNLAAHTVSLAAAQRLGDLAEQARTHRVLG